MKEIDNLIELIDNSDDAKRIKELNKKIAKDTKLLHLLEEYSYTKSEKTKEEIIGNSLFQEYKVAETEINLIIMSINKKLKEITSSKGCNL